MPCSKHPKGGVKCADCQARRTRAAPCLFSLSRETADDRRGCKSSQGLSQHETCTTYACAVVVCCFSLHFQFQCSLQASEATGHVFSFGGKHRCCAIVFCCLCILPIKINQIQSCFLQTHFKSIDTQNKGLINKAQLYQMLVQVARMECVVLSFICFSVCVVLIVRFVL